MRDYPLGLIPPRGCEVVLIVAPLRMSVLPVSHDLVDLAIIETAHLPLSFRNKMAEECWAWGKRQMGDLPV